MLSIAGAKSKQAKPQSGANARNPRRSRQINALLFPDVSLDPRIASLLTLLLLIVFTLAIRSLDQITHGSRPYTILYLIPVAFGGAFMGLRGGLAASLVALFLARFTVFNPRNGYLHFSDMADMVEFLVLVMGTIFISSVTGRLHNVIRDLHRLHSRLLQSEERRETFSREILYAVTGGRLLLCDQAELQTMIVGRPALTFPLNDTADVGALRTALREVIARLKLEIREDDLFTCATEAAANAINHGNGGEAQAYLEKEELCLVIADHGPGISPANLARATLERGFSTQVSLGMGFVMMLEAADALVLSTSEKGTTVLMRISGNPRISMEENLLARFAAGSDL
ncbi:MAG TPA: ATP-binding protein [Capsulimonadaceae bacterium]|nr:ATP-binding protein [Capsulimonadaceae bacterium]